MAGKDKLGTWLGTQLDAEEGHVPVESFKDAQSLGLSVPTSWQSGSQGSTLEEPGLQEPPHKKRRSSAANDKSSEIMNALESEISQRPSWDVRETSANLEKQLVQIVQMELKNTERKPSPAQPEQPREQDNHLDADAVWGEVERDVAAQKVGGRTKLGRKFDFNKNKDTVEGRALKKAYAAIGNDRKAQTAFKVMWWNQKIKDGKFKTELQDVDEVTEAFNGMYKPLGKIIVDQGNDAPAVMKGFNIAKSCIKLWKKGLLFKGKTYVKYNTYSKGVEFLDITEMVTDAKTRRKIESILNDENDDADDEEDDDDPVAPKRQGQPTVAPVAPEEAREDGEPAEDKASRHEPAEDRPPQDQPASGKARKNLPNAKPKQPELPADMNKSSRHLSR